MAGKEKEQKERYLKIPYHILNIEGLSLSDKVLLAHIYSFAKKGWMYSLGSSERQISNNMGKIEPGSQNSS